MAGRKALDAVVDQLVSRVASTFIDFLSSTVGPPAQFVERAETIAPALVLTRPWCGPSTPSVSAHAGTHGERGEARTGALRETASDAGEASEALCT